MITATDLELRAGARMLLAADPLRVAGRPDRPGRPQRRRQDDRCGCWPARRCRTPAPSPHAARSATCRRTRAPATWTSAAGDRVLSARGLDTLLRELTRRSGTAGRRARRRGAGAPVRPAGGAVRRARRLRRRGEAARICSHLGLPDRVLAQPLGTLSGGQRRRVELARILFADWPAADHAAAGRADQPPRRRLDRLAAGLPARRHAAAWS